MYSAQENSKYNHSNEISSQSFYDTPTEKNHIGSSIYFEGKDWPENIETQVTTKEGPVHPHMLGFSLVNSLEEPQVCNSFLDK